MLELNAYKVILGFESDGVAEFGEAYQCIVESDQGWRSQG